MSCINFGNSTTESGIFLQWSRRLAFQRWHYLISKCPCSWWIPSISEMRRQMVVCPVSSNRDAVLVHANADGKLLIDEEEKAESLTMTPRFCSRFPTADSCCNTLDSLIYLFKRFFESICPLPESYNAQYLFWNLSEMATLWTAISPFLIFKTCWSALDACLGAKLYHTTHIPTHPYHHSQFLVWCKNNQISFWGLPSSLLSSLPSSPTLSSLYSPPPPPPSVVSVETFGCVDDGVATSNTSVRASATHALSLLVACTWQGEGWLIGVCDAGLYPAIVRANAKQQSKNIAQHYYLVHCLRYATTEQLELLQAQLQLHM